MTRSVLGFAHGRRWLMMISAVAVVGTSLLPRQSSAADLPHSTQALLVLRALAYDRNLEARASDSSTLVVLYDPSNADSMSARNGMVKAFEKAASKWKVSGVSLRITSQPYSAGTLGRALSDAVAVYLCPGLSKSVGAITSATEREKVLSFTGSDRDVRAGVSIGVIGRGGKPKILVNLRSVRHEGVKLGSALLRLAEVVA